MLITTLHPPHRQSGVILIVALIVLVGMTLAGISLMRSVDTTTLITGNLSFQQAAVHSADPGIETAIAWIENNPGLLNADSISNGYAANGLTATPPKLATQSWDAYWLATWSARATGLTDGSGNLVADASGNTARWVIDRLCANAGAPSSGGSCASSPVISSTVGGGEEGGEATIATTSSVYYRITSRVQGPRNTVSFVQAIISR
jgi:type IV pilus assembly protein PilX